jgi:hypothetical protein
MVDVDPFLTTLYVMADDFGKTSWPPESPPGPQAALSRSEPVPWAIFGPWHGCGRARGFSRSAPRHVRPAFPPLPPREPCQRQVRQPHDALVAYFLPLPPGLAAQRCLDEALASTGVPPRAATRRGAGWLPGLAEMGWSNRWGWYEGLPLLVAVTPTGMLPGCGCGAASPKAQPLAETCFALRSHSSPALPRVGPPAVGPDVGAKGFEGSVSHAGWKHRYGAPVLCPSQRNSKPPGPKPLRRWCAGMRQIVETVDEKLHHTCRLDRERPHELSGVRARWAAKIALHNFCIWLKLQLDRPHLAFTDLVDW